MKNKTNRYLMLVIFILVCGFIALNILAINHARAMMYFSNEGCRTTKPELLSLGEKIMVLFMGVPAFPSADLLVFWGGRQFGFNGFKHNPVDYAWSVSCPILFIHGSNDPRVRIEEARQVFDVVSARKEFKEFPETGHEGYVARFSREWEQTVGRFLTQVIQKQ